MKTPREVYGKEVIISPKVFNGLLEQKFGEKLLVQDIWFDKETGLHLKLAKIGRSLNLTKKGFERVIDPTNYTAKEKLDDEIIQVLQGVEVINRSW